MSDLTTDLTYLILHVWIFASYISDLKHIGFVPTLIFYQSDLARQIFDISDVMYDLSFLISYILHVRFHKSNN